jgi:protease II
MANGRKGNYGWSLAASTAIAVGGLYLTAALANQSPELARATIVSIPVLQVVSSILIERKTAERRHARRNR